MEEKVILEFLYREISDINYEFEKYRRQLDDCQEYSREYWRVHDRYNAALVKKGYLIGLIRRLEGEESNS